MRAFGLATEVQVGCIVANILGQISVLVNILSTTVYLLETSILELQRRIYCNYISEYLVLLDIR
jgi:hypothetical protein